MIVEQEQYVDFHCVWHVDTIMSMVFMMSWETCNSWCFFSPPSSEVWGSSSSIITVLSLDTVPWLLGERSLTRSHPGSGKQSRDKGWREPGDTSQPVLAAADHAHKMFSEHTTFISMLIIILKVWSQANRGSSSDRRVSGHGNSSSNSLRFLWWKLTERWIGTFLNFPR